MPCGTITVSVLESFKDLLMSSVKDTINPLQLFIFTNIICCSGPPLSVDYFIYFNFTQVSSIVYQSPQL